MESDTAAHLPHGCRSSRKAAVRVRRRPLLTCMEGSSLARPPAPATLEHSALESRWLLPIASKRHRGVPRHVLASQGCSWLRGLIARWFFDWEVDEQRGAAAGWAVELERPAECLDSVAEPDESGSALRVGASDPVVADLHLEPSVLGVDGDHGVVGVRVLEDVRERFADDEVRRCLYARRQPLDRDVHGDRQRDA